MNTRMWNAPPTQANMALLGQRGVHVVGPATGRLACGATGPGRRSGPQGRLTSPNHSPKHAYVLAASMNAASLFSFGARPEAMIVLSTMTVGDMTIP